MKLAFFGYAWNRFHKPDAYMLETVDALVQAGADVDIYLGSKLSKEYGIYGLNDAINVDRLVAFMAGEHYDGAIAFNNSMLIDPVRHAIKGRIATVIVDEPEHLFDYPRAGPYEVFRTDIEIVAMSTALERRLIDEVKGVQPRLHFMLPATHIDPGEHSAAPLYPISWVASYVGDFNLDQYLTLITERPEFYAMTRRCIDLIERDGDLRSLRGEAGADGALIKQLPWSFDYFQTQMQNILTNRSRVAAVERLSPHGLALFGNTAWQRLLTYNAAVLAALQPGPPPASHADLRRVYNASRVSINMPQAHVSRDAVQYRVIDVMASNSLMITQHSKNSDLYRVFGQDCPVPTYSDLDELEALCVRYLADEDARRSLVAQCNALVAKGFSFADRAADFLRIIGLEPTASAGRLRDIDISMFSA